MYDAYFQKTQKSQTRENVIPTADRLLNGFSKALIRHKAEEYVLK